MSKIIKNLLKDINEIFKEGLETMEPYKIITTEIQTTEDETELVLVGRNHHNDFPITHTLLTEKDLTTVLAYIKIKKEE